MKIRTLICMLFLALASGAMAQDSSRPSSFELNLTDIRVPPSLSGSLNFRGCDNCPFRMARVDASTVWEVNGASVPLARFRAAVARVVDRDRCSVTVLRNNETDRITLVAVTIRQ